MKANKLSRVVCGISGGVDSSVAALLLKKHGYELVGAYMRNWDGKEENGYCKADRDAEDAEKTCRILNIPFTEITFVKEYWNHIFENLLNDYQLGLTPNPDILCNHHIKFDSFFTYAREKLGADLIATGHYATTALGTEPKVKLMMAQDSFKDQTFFLSHVNQIALQRTLFPIGHLLKSQVRQLACDAGLHHVAKRPDSTGICFVGKRSFQSFISEYIGSNPGPFVDVDTGEEVGVHQGIHLWTFGQRCRIKNQTKPYFVASKDPKSRTIFVALGADHPALFSNSFSTGPPHWIHSSPLLDREYFDCSFRFQHTKPLAPIRISQNSSGLFVNLSQPHRSISPGQYAVFYSNGECLGCAKIIQRDGIEVKRKVISQ